MQYNNYIYIHKSATVCDAHCDTVERIIKHKLDIGNRSKQGHIDLPRLFDGGIDVQVFACCVGGPGKPSGSYIKLAKKMINALHTQFKRHSDSIELALTLSDIQRINKKGSIAAIIAIEGGEAIEDNLSLIKEYYDLGVRIMTLTWKSTNWADASQQRAKHNGLTDFGKSVVQEMNKIGMIIDVSHSSDKTTLDVLNVSNDPIIASHSNAKAICNHPRNLSDDLINRISKSGGVININFYSLFLDQNYYNKVRKKQKADPPSINKVIEHIEYIIKTGSIDAVGLGSDFDGMNIPPKGLEDVSKVPEITRLLMEKGYIEEELYKILGGNFLRVFGQVCGI